MNYFSTNRRAPVVGFKEAVINSLPPDKGLYFPETIPVLSKEVLNNFRSMSLPEIGFEMMKPFVADIPKKELRQILVHVFSFDIPLVQVEEGIYSLELFHGPTYAFKDVGARFLANCLGYFSKDFKKETTILVATSGDTGGAVANGFHNVEGVTVVILYPSGQVSELQEKQLTALEGNIHAVEVNGDFDNCQALVKQAFLDPDLNQKLNLTSANSINIARWMPQSIYFAWMLAQFEQGDKPLVAVPSGNYGNITAGIFAKKLGFPLGTFLACSNANDAVPRYLKSRQYSPKPTVATYANAMDVSDPSNFPRLLELYGGSYEYVAADVQGFSLTDNEILKTIQEAKRETNYTLDPHGAIGYAGLKSCLKSGQKAVFLETAHPVKFDTTIALALGSQQAVPDFAKSLLKKEKKATFMCANFEDFKSYLFSNC